MTTYPKNINLGKRGAKHEKTIRGVPVISFLVGCSAIEEGPKKLDMDQYNRIDEDALKKKKDEDKPIDEEESVFD